MPIANSTHFVDSLEYALHRDHGDPMADFREQFHIPKKDNGEDKLYFCGNSLGLQPKSTSDYIQQELEDWARYAVEGHEVARKPWLPYHEHLTKNMANVVGAKESEVVVMNTLTVNLHLMMVSFYRPTSKRNKILIEADAFPSDRYAVESQIRFHGLDPKDVLIELSGTEENPCLSEDAINHTLQQHGQEIALILFGNVNYFTGQFFNMKHITTLGHAQGCIVGFDCAHGAGNVLLNLHASGADFAVWCTYKYLNSGPGSIAGCFVHERHSSNSELPRFAGWWGHNKTTRFKMPSHFDPISGAEGWQLSNPPILSLAAIRASLDIFAKAGIGELRSKSIELTGYMEFLLSQITGDRIRIISPLNPENRGCQLSIKVANADKNLHKGLMEAGIVADWREPDVIRLAPTPLYNRFEDVWRMIEQLKILLSQ